jgi:hypothetical protein
MKNMELVPNLIYHEENKMKRLRVRVCASEVTPSTWWMGAGYEAGAA